MGLCLVTAQTSHNNPSYSEESHGNTKEANMCNEGKQICPHQMMQEDLVIRQLNEQFSLIFSSCIIAAIFK